jgi:diguanylate cyclase (GGDEF)-like protein
MRELRRFLLPDGALIAAAFAAAHITALQAPAADLAAGLLVAAVAAGVVLSFRFHRGRVVLALVMLAFADRILTAAAAPATDGQRAAVALLAILFPLNLAGLALLPERGTLTRSGLVRLGALALEILLVAPFTEWNPVRTSAILTDPILPQALTSWTTLPQFSLIAGLAGLALFLTLWIREPSPIARGLFWTLAGTLLALDAHGRAQEPTIWLAAAGFVLALSVVEASYTLAYHDGLTGLPARRAFTEALRRLGERYAVAMVDVDHFKACNDQWGHDVGDQVLRMVAAKLTKVGGGGTAYRYGGEEFALLFPGKVAEEVRPNLEEVREAVEAAVFVVRHRPRPHRRPTEARPRGSRVKRVAVTISIGLSEPGKGRATADLVVAAADQALYRAKESGRNRVKGPLTD